MGNICVGHSSTSVANQPQAIDDIVPHSPGRSEPPPAYFSPSPNQPRSAQSASSQSSVFAEALANITSAAPAALTPLPNASQAAETVFTTHNGINYQDCQTNEFKREGGLCVGMTARFLEHYLVNNEEIANCSPAGPDGFADPTSYISQMSYQNNDEAYDFHARNPDLGADDSIKLKAVFEKSGLDIAQAGDYHRSVGSLLTAIRDQEPGTALAVEQEFFGNDGTLTGSHLIGIIPDSDGTIKVMDPNIGLVSVGRDNITELEDIFSARPENTQATFQFLFTVKPLIDSVVA